MPDEKKQGWRLSSLRSDYGTRLVMKGLERAFPERAYAYHAEMENRARAKYAKYGEDGQPRQEPSTESSSGHRKHHHHERSTEPRSGHRKHHHHHERSSRSKPDRESHRRRPASVESDSEERRPRAASRHRDGTSVHSRSDSGSEGKGKGKARALVPYRGDTADGDSDEEHVYRPESSRRAGSRGRAQREPERDPVDRLRDLMREL